MKDPFDEITIDVFDLLTEEQKDMVREEIVKGIISCVKNMKAESLDLSEFIERMMRRELDYAIVFCDEDRKRIGSALADVIIEDIKRRLK